MNLHTNQCYETDVESRFLISSEQNIITPQESKPVIVISQDSLVASYLMTKNDFSLSRYQFNDLTMCGEKIDGSPLWDSERIKTIKTILYKHDKNTNVMNGRGLFSLMLPHDFNYTKENKASEKEPVVRIEQGVLYEGILEKSTLGSAHGSIIQILNKEYGEKITANFINNVQFIGNNWLVLHGFSVGLEDCVISSEKGKLAIQDTLMKYYVKAKGIEDTTRNEGIKEVRITSALSQARDIGMKIAKDAMKPTNNFLATVNSGAKGDFFNISQLTSLLGQQNLNQKRVIPQLNNGKRTLPHYPLEGLENDKEREYESRGFIRHSFIQGLTPEEFFFHAMSGREGVCDTSMGTSQSGYMQRKIIKLYEDIQVQYDGTIRDSSSNIYQFVYGETGYDSTKTVPVMGKQQPCDISRLVDRLNTCYEQKIEIPVEKVPKFTIKEIKEYSIRKEEMVNKIKNKYSVEVDENLEMDELEQLLEKLDAEELIKDDLEFSPDDDEEEESENEDTDNEDTDNEDRSDIDDSDEEDDDPYCYYNGESEDVIDEKPIELDDDY